MQRLVRTLVLALLGLILTACAMRSLHPQMLGVAHVAGGREGPVNLPWTFDGASKDDQLEVHFSVHWFTPRKWRIVPDDLLTGIRVDGRPVPLTTVPATALRDYRNGFELDLSDWLHPGDNDIEFTLTNTGGPGGLALEPVMGWRVAILAMALLPWMLALAYVFRLRREHIAILCGALLVLCFYWAATTWHERTYDVKRFGEGGHLDYVAYVAEHAALPPPNGGWEYYQPPAYYLGGALVWRAASRIGAYQPEALRAFSVILWIVFLVAGTATIERAVPRRRAGAFVATLSLALWPAGVMAAPRIGNDVTLYAAAAVATYFLVSWWRGRRPRRLIGASAFVGLALLVKGTAAALLAALLALLLLRMMRHGRWRRARAWLDVLPAAAVATLGAIASLFRNVWAWRHGQIPSWLVSNITYLDASLRVPNRIRDYVPLDVPTFLGSPWVDTRDDATGRANFWNFLLRSSLTGEFKFEGDFHRDVALALGVALLAVLGLLALSVARKPPSIKALWRSAPLVLLGAAWLGSLMSSRILYPFSCMADLRYVVPILVPLLVWCARGGWATKVPLCFIALASAVFFVTI